MRKPLLVILVLIAILVFPSVRDELLKTRESVRKEIEGTRKETFVEIRKSDVKEKDDEGKKKLDIIDLKKCCDGDGDWVTTI